MTARPAVDVRRVIIEEDADAPGHWLMLDEAGNVSAGSAAELERTIRRQDARRARANPAVVATVIEWRAA